jgi:hypothetical protein
MREIEQNPYVKKCQDLFGAEIVKIDPPQQVSNQASYSSQ